MKKKLWITLALLMVIPAFMLAVGCQKKVATVVKEPVAKEEPKKEEPAPSPA